MTCRPVTCTCTCSHVLANYMYDDMGYSNSTHVCPPQMLCVYSGLLCLQKPLTDREALDQCSLNLYMSGREGLQQTCLPTCSWDTVVSILMHTYMYMYHPIESTSTSIYMYIEYCCVVSMAICTLCTSTIIYWVPG